MKRFTDKAMNKPAAGSGLNPSMPSGSIEELAEHFAREGVGDPSETNNITVAGSAVIRERRYAPNASHH